MSSRFIMPFADVGSGIKPSSGAQLFFFEVDGVTPKDTYSDQLATPTPNSNPVIADSTGVFSDIYIINNYKVTLKDKNGSQIFGGALIEEVAGFNDLSLSYTFKSVAEMKGTVINFPEGKVIFWQGYYDQSDGGSNWGVIKKGSHAEDGGSIFSIDANTYVEANIENCVSLAKFGVRGDGVQYDTESFKSAVLYANENSIDISCPSGFTIRLNGADIIDIKTSCNFNGSKIDVNEFEGTLLIAPSQDAIVYDDASNVVLSLVAAGTITGNYWSGWDGVTEVEDSFVTINTTQDFYSYRGNITKRIELNKSLKYGYMESRASYSLDPNDIVDVEVRKIEQGFTEFKNVSFIIDTNDVSNLPTLQIKRSLTKVSKVRFVQSSGALANINPTYVSITEACHVELEDVYFAWANYSTQGSGFTYLLGLSRSYDVTFNRVRGTGDGWGANGSNLCRKVEFKNCTLSRIDFHQPIFEYLRITDCDLGSWGVLVTMIGDLVINGGKFILGEQANVNKQGFIRTREDCGGFCDGELKVSKTKFEYVKSGGIEILKQQDSLTNPKPAGSPIEYTMFRTINYDGITANYPANNIKLMPQMVVGTSVTMPYQIVMNDIVDGNFSFAGSLADTIPNGGAVNNSASPMNEDQNLHLLASNVKLAEALTVTDKVNNFNVNFNFDGLRGVRSLQYVPIEFTVCGQINFEKSSIEGIDFFAGGAFDKYIYLNIDSSTIIFNQELNTLPINGFVPGRTFVAITDSLISPTNSGDRENYLLARLKGNQIGAKGIVASPIYLFGTAGGGTITFDENINPGNSYLAKSGFSGNNSLTYQAFNLPTLNRSSYIVYSSTTEESATRTAADTLTFSGSYANGLAILV